MLDFPDRIFLFSKKIHTQTRDEITLILQVCINDTPSIRTNFFFLNVYLFFGLNKCISCWKITV